jgi:hypothetical protein
MGETVRLVDLLDKAKEKSKIALLKRGKYQLPIVNTSYIIKEAMFQFVLDL